MFQASLRRVVVLAIATVSVAACAAAPAVASKGKKDVVCNGTLEKLGEVTGNVKHDVIVPVNQVCVITKATVGHDVILEAGSYVGVDSTTVKHSIIGHSVSTFETNFEPNPGPNVVGHDIELTGIQNNTEHANGYDICDTTIKHNLVISNTATPFGTVIGDTGTGPEEFCSGGPDPKVVDTIGHDVVIANNVFGRLDIGNNTITHNMTIETNTGTKAFGDLGTLDISDNSVGHNATCAANTPKPEGDGTEDGPNHVAHKNSGC